MLWIGKISFCLLLWQSITLMSSALNRTQAVRLCLFCDHHHRGNTPQAEHIFPDFFDFPWLFSDHCQIPWLFQILQVAGRPEYRVTWDHRSVPAEWHLIPSNSRVHKCDRRLPSRRRCSWARLRSAASRTCVVTRTYSTFGDRAFWAAGPGLWNSLPSHLKDADITYSEFRRLLKTFLFGQWGHGAVWTVLTAPLRNIRTYLLTYLRHTHRQSDRPCYGNTCRNSQWLSAMPPKN